MKEKIFDDMNTGPFKARVDERFHKLGQDCPDDGWVEGYLYRDLDGGEVAPFIYNCPCRWRVIEETIKPVGFHIAKWIKVEDRLPESGIWVLISQHGVNVGLGQYINGVWWDDMDCRMDVEPTYWMPIVPPKED